MTPYLALAPYHPAPLRGGFPFDRRVKYPRPLEGYANTLAAWPEIVVIMSELYPGGEHQ